MKCVIPNRNINTLSRCFHTLVKLGDSVFIEIHQTHMLIQAISLSQSAFGCFKLDDDFFTSYISTENTIKCKIALKSCFHAFKSLSLEKSVEECHLEAEEGADEMKVIFFCKHSIVKTFKLPFIDLELLNANFSKEKCKSEIISPSKVLQECVQSFLSTVDEVTLKVTNDKIIVKNYTEDEPDKTKIVHTEKRLEIDEFLKYKINEDVDLTFCLKELKAILTFAEGCKNSLPVNINFNKAGDAIIFSIKSDNGWDACFVLATLSDCGSGDSQKESSGTLAKDSENICEQVGKRNKVNMKQLQKNLPKTVNITTPGMVDAKAAGDLPSSSKSYNATPKVYPILDLSDSDHDDFPTQPIQQVSQPKLIPVEDDDQDNSPTQPIQQVSQPKLIPVEDDDAIPASPPPPKRFKYIFLAKTNYPKYTSQLKADETVLAPDSDEDTL